MTLTAKKNADTYSIRVDRPYSHLLMQVSRSRLQLDKQLKSPSSHDVMQSTCKDSQLSLQFPNSFHPLIPFSDFISNAVPCSYECTIFVGVFLIRDPRTVRVQDFWKANVLVRRSGPDYRKGLVFGIWFPLKSAQALVRIYNSIDSWSKCLSSIVFPCERFAIFFIFICSEFMDQFCAMSCTIFWWCNPFQIIFIGIWIFLNKRLLEYEI